MKQILSECKALLLLVLIAIVGAGHVLAVQKTNVTNVKIMVVSPKKMNIYKSYMGYLKPFDRVVVKAETSGTVEKIDFEEGEKVKKGQVLVHISTSELELRKSMAKTKYDQALVNYKLQKNLFVSSSNSQDEKNQNGKKEYIATRRLRLQENLAKSNYEFALSEYEAQKKLFEKQLISSKDFQKYRNTMEINLFRYHDACLDVRQSEIADLTRLEDFKNTLEINKIDLNLAALELDKSKIKAPFNGIVKDKIVQLGGFVQKGSDILEIMDISNVLAKINIPEKEVRYLDTGKTVSIGLDAIPGVEFSGRIKTMGMEADRQSRSFPAEIVIDNTDRRLLPGMMARIELLAKSEKNQVIVPRHAVVERERGSMVYVVEKGVAVQKQVRIGEMIRENVQIVAGLEFGDQLIVIGQDLLSNNEAVNVVNANKKIAQK